VSVSPQREQQQTPQPVEVAQRSLYRRHRPRTFAEMVGQEPVVRTLSNAVTGGKVHHAYLFVGPRGTGKTSTAKILAACLNCEHGPTIEPCGECESCRSIASASSLDVIEMDAASNNSVDDIRELRESVAYAPVSGRRKVYILDEAHMLSTAAWNAFLKTLEEPPPNTVFVLATTEAQKVPATVIDRCHRFDFHRPTVEQLGSVITRTAQAESIQIPPEAVTALARSAEGSFRDALGTLEQLVTYSGPEIALADVLAVLGVADAALLARTVDAVAAGDARAALEAVSECAEQGRDAGSFAADLEVRARELLVVQTLGEVPGELSLTAEADSALLAQARRVDHATVVALLELLAGAMEAVRAGGDPRTRLELALVKAAEPRLDGSTRALLARIERLEAGSGAGVAPLPGPSGPVEPAPQAVSEPAGETAGGDDEGLPQAATVPSVGEGEGAARVSRGLEDLCELWPSVVELVRAGHALCGAVIADARPVEVRGEDLTVGFPTAAAFLKKKAEDPDNRRIVRGALRELTGAGWRVSYELREDLDSDEDGGAGARYSEEEWVARFKAELDAEEIPVEPLPAQGAEKGA
jgi:DNA polymerase III subunit gamma/tau